MSAWGWPRVWNVCPTCGAKQPSHNAARMSEMRLISLKSLQPCCLKHLVRMTFRGKAYSESRFHKESSGGIGFYWRRSLRGASDFFNTIRLMSAAEASFAISRKWFPHFELYLLVGDSHIATSRAYRAGILDCIASKTVRSLATARSRNSRILRGSRPRPA